MRKVFKIAVLVFGMIWNAGLAQASVTCPLVLAGEFPVTTTHWGLPVIDIKIGGKNFRMMVDTGAAVSTLTTSSWEALGDPPYQRINGDYATGIGGYAQLNTAILEDVENAHFKSRDQVFIVADDDVPQAKGKPLVDGSLGYDFLDNFDIGFDLPDHRISLYFLSTCDTAQAPWPGNYDVEALSLNSQTRESWLPFGIGNRTFSAIIDSGSSFTTVALSSLHHAGVTPDAAPAKLTDEVTGAGLHEAIAHREMFGNVTIGAESFSNAWLNVINMPKDRSFDVLLGEDYLATHRVFISNSSASVLLGLSVPVQR
jgi:predicted aspartyl protease